MRTRAPQWVLGALLCAALSPPAPGQGQAEGAPSAFPAVEALLEAARAAGAQGEGERAAALLERALRIAPRDAWVWHRLAVLRLQQRAWRSAEDFALRSNALSAEPRLLAGNWEVIARARAEQGDRQGAGEARAAAARQQAP